jgi:hypothetical protein
MPQNLAVGDDAQAIAEFLAKYSGRDAKSPPGPGSAGGSTEDTQAQ